MTHCQAKIQIYNTTCDWRVATGATRELKSSLGTRSHNARGRAGKI